MRQHFKLKGLVVHVTPNTEKRRIKTYIRGEREELKLKFDRGTITVPELHKLSLFMMIEKNSKKDQCGNSNSNSNKSPFKENVRTTYTVEFNGKQLVFTVEEYERYKRAFNK